MDFDHAKNNSQCYVALSRVQEMSQVYIVDKLHEECAGWKVNSSAIRELENSLKNAIKKAINTEKNLKPCLCSSYFPQTFLQDFQLLPLATDLKRLGQDRAKIPQFHFQSKSGESK